MMIVLVSLLFVPTLAMAAPFFTCDDPPEEECVTSYVLSINDGAKFETPAPLHYDLAGIPDGPLKIDVEAKNVRGVSISVPFIFSNEPPSVAVGATIVID